MSETGGSHRASWRPGSAESGRAGPRQVWRGVGGEGEMEEGGRLARRLGRGMSGSGGFTSGKRISVSACARRSPVASGGREGGREDQ